MDLRLSIDKLKLTLPGHDGKRIFRRCRFVVENHWKGQEVEQVQVTALDPRPVQSQGDLFKPADVTRRALLKAVDAINERYGEFTIVPAAILERSPLPDVISPAWKPEGPRRNV